MVTAGVTLIEDEVPSPEPQVYVFPPVAVNVVGWFAQTGLLVADIEIGGKLFITVVTELTLEQPVAGSVPLI